MHTYWRWALKITTVNDTKYIYDDGDDWFLMMSDGVGDDDGMMIIK